MNARQILTAARFLFLLVLVSLSVSWISASPLRVTTWNLQPSSAAGSNGWSASFQKNLVRSAAGSLKNLSPDLIILQQVASWDVCQELTQALQPANYEVAVCSTFRDPRTKRLGRQTAILSKTRAHIGWSEPWQNNSESPNEGYVFAVIPLGDKNVGVFSIQASSGQRWSGKIIKQISSFQNWSDNRPQAFIVTGDFVSSDVALEQIGFQNDSVPSGCIFTKNAGEPAPPAATLTALCEHPAATFEVDFDAPPGSHPSLATAPNSLTTAPMSGNFWWIAAGVAVVVVLALTFALRLRTSKQRTTATTLRSASQMVATPGERPSFVHIETEGSVQTQSQTWRLPQDAVRPKPPLPEPVQARLVTNLSQWLKHAVVRRLLSDRARLVATQEAAALRVLEVDKRLAKVERQIQQQQRDYERRIEDLLRELVAAKEENRELIRAKIAVVKAEMEKARQRATAELQK
ncbi:MAG TPA: hypothetical protein VGN61_02540 [Verrucomicrobiae bacterium]|jgi:hypothetical protein